MAKFKVQTAEGQEVEVDITVDQLPKEIKDDIIKQATGISYGNIDAKLESLGFQKTQGEKTSDFLERVVKAQMDKVQELETAKPDVSKFQATIDELKADLKATKTALKEKDGEISAKLLQKDIESQVKLIANDITVPQYLTEPDEIESFKATQEQMIMSKLQNGYKARQVEGKLQFLDGDNIVENSDRDVASIKDIVTKDFGFLFKKPKQGQGQQGQQGQGGKPNGSASVKASSYEEAVNIVVEKHKGTNAGMLGSREFFEALNPILQENGIQD